MLTPGDPIPLPAPPQSGPLLLGPGIYCRTADAALGTQNGEPAPFATKAGVLRQTRNGVTVSSRQKRYVPSQGDHVVAIVESRMGEGFRVDVGAAQPGFLPGAAFEGAASKKTRPNLPPGSAVFARVAQHYGACEPELSCVNPATHKADGFGLLEGGFVVTVPLQQSRDLLAPRSAKVAAFGTALPVELAVGINGRIWVRAPDAGMTRQVVGLLQRMDGLSSEDVASAAAEISRSRG